MEARATFLDLLGDARRLTADRLAEAPDYGPLISVDRQLAFLDAAVRADRALTDAEVDSVTFGRYAAREFEDSDPEYAEALHRVYHRVRRGDGVRRERSGGP